MKTTFTFYPKVTRLLFGLSIIGLVIGGISSCKKESTTEQVTPTPVKTPTKTELLTSKSWKMTALTIAPDMMGMTDLYAEMDDCEKDNTMKFNADANKSLILDMGGKKCDMSEPQSKSETWSLSADETTLTAGTTIYTIISVDADKLKMSTKMMIDGKEYVATCTHSHTL